MQNILEESMGEVIEFPIELTRPPAGIAYDLDTVAVVSDVLYQIMEDREYKIDQNLKNDIKVLTNLAYAAVRRQAEEKNERHHPFQDVMNDMSGTIDTAMEAIKKDEET